MAVFYFLKQKRERGIIFCVAGPERKLEARNMGRCAREGRLRHVLLLPTLCNLLCLAEPSRIQNRRARSERKGIASRLEKHTRGLNVEKYS